jgi:hypothetical protein
MIQRKDATTARGKERKQYEQRFDRGDTENLAGDYPNTLTLKKGDVRSPELVFDFADVKVRTPRSKISYVI